MNNNKNMRKAAKEKNDEFYTRLTDIEKELGNYWDHFRGKTILCNCDDPEESMFWIYFAMNFDHLGIKKLIATHYEKDKPSYKLELIKDINADGKINRLDTIKTTLKQSGDFRSEECIELLKEADVVVTNPPFSLFREYVAQLVEYDKKFIIIGNQNSITYKEIFKLIKEEKLWLGLNLRSGSIEFKVPDSYVLTGSACRLDDNGNKFIKVKDATWFTNLEFKKRHEDILLYKEYYGHENEYPKYDYYDAINVDKTKDIPKDFDGIMGVPISMLQKYNPEQFEIIDGLNIYSVLDGPTKEMKGKPLPQVNGKIKYFRIAIKKRSK